MNYTHPSSEHSSVIAARSHLVDQLARTGREDLEAFNAVYMLTSAKLFGICLRICSNQSGAEDVLNDVYMIVWKRAAAFDPALGSPVSWLAAIARNRAIDWRRSQRRYAAVPLDDAPDLLDLGTDAERGMLVDEQSRLLLKCLGALESRRRVAIRDAFFHDFTYAELAEREKVPLSTMKSWIRRGLRQMREAFEEPATIAAPAQDNRRVLRTVRASTVSA